MTIMKYIRTLFKKGSSAKVKSQLEYVEENIRASSPIALEQEAAPVPCEADVPPATQVRIEDVAFSPQRDLEAYVQGLNVTEKTIEGWIAAGVLLPEEIKTAEKMIKIIRKNDKTYIH